MSNKETKLRVANAFRAMKNIGISEAKVKPVLKNLLKLYDKNWELIEEENYRALADAIFEREEAEAEEHSRKIVNREAAKHPKKISNSEKGDYLEEEAQATEERERPLKRLRHRYRSGQSSSNAPNSGSPRIPIVRPKEEPIELPETCTPKLNALQGVVESPQAFAESKSTISQAVTCQLHVKNKGKQPISPNSLIAQEGCDPFQPASNGRNQQNAQLVAEFRSPSHAMRLKDRGKGSVSSQIPPGEKRPVPEGKSDAACLKEPQVEPRIVLSPKQNSTASHALIKPKDEPITDDMAYLAVPTAVIYPDSLNGGNISNGDGTIREHGILEPSFSPLVNEKETVDGIAIPNEPRNRGDRAAISGGRCSSDIEIASSPSGEVKISLNCNLAPGGPDFEMPSLETVLKSVEEKCLRSYKILDPNFSLMNLMKEMCQCFLTLAYDSDNESLEGINVLPNIDLLNMQSAKNAHSSRSPCFSSLNGSGDSRIDSDATLPKELLLPPSCSSTDVETCQKNMDGRDECRNDNTKNRDNFVEETNNLSLVVVQQPCVTPEMIRSLHDAVDIAKGQEKAVIMLVNEVNNECLPSFHYIPQNVVFQNAHVNLSLAHIGDKDCCSACFGDCLTLCTPCACAHRTGGEFAYTTDGLVKEEILKVSISTNRDPKKYGQNFCEDCPLERSKSEDIVEPCKGHLVRKFIKECWWKCGCNKLCGNRVVQGGITRNFQVFMTPEGKGWGLRTLEDLPQGAFVCEYVGEVLTIAELFGRVLRSPKVEKYSYPVLLDAGWGAKGVLKDEEALCLDATYYGNVARFINHRCYDSNLVEIPVEVETPDHNYYHLAFFTTRKVKAMEELTWDYGIDFDDLDHPIKAFHCLCGSNFCRNIKRSRSRGCKKMT